MDSYEIFRRVRLTVAAYGRSGRGLANPFVVERVHLECSEASFIASGFWEAHIDRTVERSASEQTFNESTWRSTRNEVQLRLRGRVLKSLRKLRFEGEPVGIADLEDVFADWHTAAVDRRLRTSGFTEFSSALAAMHLLTEESANFHGQEAAVLALAAHSLRPV